jgi:hypothetical protein
MINETPLKDMRAVIKAYNLHFFGPHKRGVQNNPFRVTQSGIKVETLDAKKKELEVSYRQTINAPDLTEEQKLKKKGKESKVKRIKNADRAVIDNELKYIKFPADMLSNPANLENLMPDLDKATKGNPQDLETLEELRRIIHLVDKTAPITNVRATLNPIKGTKAKIRVLIQDISKWTKDFYLKGNQAQGSEVYEPKPQEEKHGTAAKPATIHTPFSDEARRKEIARKIDAAANYDYERMEASNRAANLLGRGLKKTSIIGQGLPHKTATYGSPFSGQVFKYYK